MADRLRKRSRIIQYFKPANSKKQKTTVEFFSPDVPSDIEKTIVNDNDLSRKASIILLK